MIAHALKAAPCAHIPAEISEGERERERVGDCGIQMFCLTRGNSVPANRSSNPLSSFIKCNLPCVIELSNAGESGERGGEGATGRDSGDTRP